MGSKFSKGPVPDFDKVKLRSSVDQMLEKICDREYLARMTERDKNDAYRRILGDLKDKARDRGLLVPTKDPKKYTAAKEELDDLAARYIDQVKWAAQMAALENASGVTLANRDLIFSACVVE